MGSILKHPIYIDTGNLIYDSLILGRQTGFWYAKEINFRGISQNPIEEILKLLLTKKNDNGVNVVNITPSDLFRTLFFSKFRIKGLKLIKILYPSTYSLQENRMALFTVIVSSLALSISLYTVINNTTNSINNYNIIIPIIVFMVLLLIGLSVTIKPIVTRTFDPTKFDLYIGIENYAKIISKKLKTSETIAIVFRIRIDPLVDLKKLEKLFVDLPKFYNALLENIGDRLRLIIEVDSNKLLKIQNNLINNEIYSLN